MNIELEIVWERLHFDRGNLSCFSRPYFGGEPIDGGPFTDDLGNVHPQPSSIGAVVISWVVYLPEGRSKVKGWFRYNIGESATIADRTRALQLSHRGPTFELVAISATLIRHVEGVASFSFSAKGDIDILWQ